MHNTQIVQRGLKSLKSYREGPPTPLFLLTIIFLIAQNENLSNEKSNLG